MTVHIPYSRTGYFSDLVLDYLNGEAQLQPFYNQLPTPAAFAAQIEQKKNFSTSQREVLHKVLTEQYATVKEVSPATVANINQLLQPNTYTVTTGHQLCLFTGPLYFIYKIATAIRTCQELQKQYPDKVFVPVYWMATEDHDFEEVNHFKLFGKDYRWESDQKGPVGRFSTDGLNELIDSLPEPLPLFEEPYVQHRNLTDATRELVNRLFGQYGLVCLDADHAELKKQFAPVAQAELLQQTTHKLVSQATEQLTNHYKVQVSPRAINLFYIENGLRERIEKTGNTWKVLNTNLEFTEADLVRLCEETPERLSPNVLLRPLYQETILPNLSYIGGGAEVAYWLELKPLFEHFKVPYPILQLRNSFLYVPQGLSKKLVKLNISAAQLFEPMAELKKKALATEQFEEVSLASQQQAISNAFAELQTIAGAVDPTLIKAVAAEEQKALNAIAALEKRLSKAAESKHQQVLDQLQNLHARLFPNGGLQERVDNVATYLANNPQFIEQVVAATDPFKPEFTILTEE